PAPGIHLPKGDSVAAGALNTNLNIAGPTNKLITTGTVGLYKAKLAGFDLGSRMSTISALTGLKTGQDLDIEKITTNLHMAPTGLETENFLAAIPALGTLVGAGDARREEQSRLQNGCDAGKLRNLYFFRRRAGIGNRRHSGRYWRRQGRVQRSYHSFPDSRHDRGSEICARRRRDCGKPAPVAAWLRRRGRFGS